jgi:gamma-glutamyltranspeptidase/glutathione hydrolase
MWVAMGDGNLRGARAGRQPAAAWQSTIPSLEASVVRSTPPSRLLTSLLVVAAFTGGGPAPVIAQREGIPATWPLGATPNVTDAPRAMVVSGHPLASAIGRDVLRKGGNAVDAAVATAFALAVVHPEAGNIGGGGFLLYRRPGGLAHALDFRERAPRASTRDMYLDSLGNPTDKSHIGHLASGVPGSVAGLAEVHRRFGRLPWRALVDPAVALARDGFIIDAYRHKSIRADSSLLVRFAPSAAQFLPGGAPPAIGSTFRQPDLARTLERIRDRGQRGFYTGWVADSLVAEMRRGGGIISHADLLSYRAVWRTPLRLSYRGHTVLAMPPVSSGGVTLGIILNIMEGWPRLPPFGSAALLHLEAEAMRRAYIERNRHLGDPAFVRAPVARLISKVHAKSLRAQIDTTRATPTAAVVGPVNEGSSTTHLSVIDAAGGAVSLTTTINSLYGNGVTVRGAGFLMNDEMDDFTTAPNRQNVWGSYDGLPNVIEPGKRMLSSMTPAIVLDPAGRLSVVLGSPGGTTIITTVYHVISNLIDHGMLPADAVAAPRMFHQARPDTVQIEQTADSLAGFHETVVAELERLGHAVRRRSYMGDVQAIARTPAGWQGISDPRRGGGGAGY